MSKIRIILADDHSIMRTGLKLLLKSDSSMDVVGEASNGEELLKILEQTLAEVIILDLSMPGMSGLETIKEIKSRGIQTKILVLTMHTDEHYVRAAMQAGASGYLDKSVFDSELLAAVKAVAGGQLYLTNNHALLLVNSLLNSPQADEAGQDPYALLSYREREVLRLLVRGYSMAEIAKQLCLSVKTVDTHKTRIMLKLGKNKKNELVDYALEYGLLTPKEI
ncbi:response regulator transcription factor [Dendrosporobacter sp. 1207_IL3150]|uniref:response regulator transcription factor n=1 Tax=Dendrosporobacter sp. 1207_IL3150 TaxID=3084054 RepID=UPI002FDA2F98